MHARCLTVSNGVDTLAFPGLPAHYGRDSLLAHLRGLAERGRTVKVQHAKQNVRMMHTLTAGDALRVYLDLANGGA